MPTSQEEAQAAAAARREARRAAHEAKMAADIAAKGERKAARAAATAAQTEERKMSEFMQGKGMATQAYVNDASIPLAQFLSPPPLPVVPAPMMHFSDPALQADGVKRAQEERRIAHEKNVEEQRQLALFRAEEKKRAYEASLAHIAETKARKAAEAEERRVIEEANKVARQQKKEENMRHQREIQRKAMLDKASLEITVCCDQLLAAVQAQIHAYASQAGEVTKVAPISFGGGDVAFTVKFKEPHATQTCLNMTLPSIQLNIPLLAKPAVVPACFLHFELPPDMVIDEQVVPALQSLFSEFGTVVEAKVNPQRTAIIHFQEPDAASRVEDLQSQRTFYLMEHALSGLSVGKPTQGKRKRG
jgi:hypothetical protein